jgi:hypothetical protein
MARTTHHHGVAARHVDAFECLNPKTAAYAGVDPDLKARTPEECTRIALGTTVDEHEPHAQSINNEKTNIISQRERLMSLSSPEAMVMGNDVAIGLAERDFKGVIYAPQVDIGAHEENVGYDKFSDLHWRSVWSRHSGAFDIVVDYPAPKNDCRQANSNHPVNMEFYLDFPQICCNDRGPLISHECAEKCWHDSRGPVLMDMGEAIGMEGSSVIQVLITESLQEEREKKKEEGKTVPKTTGTCNVGDPKTKKAITDPYKCHIAGGIWEDLID